MGLSQFNVLEFKIPGNEQDILEVYYFTSKLEIKKYA